jgi:hypothetical protein
MPLARSSTVTANWANSANPGSEKSWWKAWARKPMIWITAPSAGMITLTRKSANASTDPGSKTSMSMAPRAPSTRMTWVTTTRVPAKNWRTWPALRRTFSVSPSIVSVRPLMVRSPSAAAPPGPAMASSRRTTASPSSKNDRA